MPTPSLEGALAALLYLVLLGAILLWISRIPPILPAEVERTLRSVDTLRRILVPTLGTAHSDRGVELACRLGSAQGAAILLAHVIEVPRTLPISAPLHDRQGEAEAALERGAEIVRLHGLEPEKLVSRARIAGEEIVRLASEKAVDLIVMGIRPRVGLREEILGRTSDIVLRRALCEVLLDKVPQGVESDDSGGGA